jgi:hypothetical protein
MDKGRIETAKKIIKNEIFMRKLVFKKDKKKMDKKVGEMQFVIDCIEEMEKEGSEA